MSAARISIPNDVTGPLGSLLLCAWGERTARLRMRTRTGLLRREESSTHRAERERRWLWLGRRVGSAAEREHGAGVALLGLKAVWCVKEEQVFVVGG